MSRVIRPQSAAGERRKLLQILAHVVTVSKTGEFDKVESKDMMEFTYTVLGEIAESITATVSAWEKRGYWIKADRFLADWSWVELVQKQVEESLEKEEDWPQPMILHKLEEHIGDITPPAQLRNTRPWIGAWSRGEDTSFEEHP